MDPDLRSERATVRRPAERRAQHDLTPLPENIHFTEARFPAVIKPAGVKFNNNGDLEVVLVIPVRYADRLDTMRLAMRTPLLVEIRRWSREDQDDGTDD